MAEIRGLSGMPLDKKIEVLDDNAIYGIAYISNVVKQWTTMYGSAKDVLDSSRNIAPVERDCDSIEEDSFLNVLFYKLDANLTPLKVISRMSVTAEQNLAMGNSKYPCAFNDLSYIENPDVEPFNGLF